MEIFQQLKEKVGETAKTAVKKSNELVESSKLKFALGDVEIEIGKMLTDIGKFVYDAYKDGVSFSEIIDNRCAEIEAKFNEADDIKAKINDLKGVTLCASCEEEICKEDTFCRKCGQKI